jgi:hypothetical protein
MEDGCGLNLKRLVCWLRSWVRIISELEMENHGEAVL